LSQQKQYRKMKIAAFVLNLLTIVYLGFTVIGIIAWIWVIPMTVHSYILYKNNQKASTAFSICELLFVNMISGILHLVDTESQNN